MWRILDLFIALIILVYRPMMTYTMEEGESILGNQHDKCKDVVIDLAFVLDSSVSVTKPNFELTKEFVKGFLMPADIDGGSVRVSVIIYSNTADVAFYLSDFNTKTDVLRAIDGINFRPGNTNTAAALQTMREDLFTEINGDRPNVDNIAIVMTDGTSNSRASTSYQAKLAKRANIHIYAVGIGLRDTRELDQIASEPTEQNRINVENFSRLKTLGNKVFAKQCKCKSQSDIIFMLGVSSKVTVNGFHTMTDFVSNAVRDLQMANDVSRVGLITFSDFPRVLFNFNTYLRDKNKTCEAMRKINYVPGSPNIAMAMRVARTSMMTVENGDRQDVPNVLVIVTGGVSSENQLENVLEARRLKSIGTTIVFITVGSQGREQLRRMTSPPADGNLIEIVDLNQLTAVAGSIVYSLCYYSNPCAHNPCQNEGLCIPGLRSYTCVCPTGYYGTNCQTACGPPADVILLLDSSSSVGPTKFSTIKSFAQMLICEMDIFICDVSVGVMKYSSTAVIEVELGFFETQDELIRAIDNIRYSTGQSNLATALKIIRTRVLNNSGRDRRDAQNIVYLVTGGPAKTFQHRALSEAELLIDSGAQLIPLNIETTTWDDMRQYSVIKSHLSMTLNSVQGLLAMSSQHSTSDNGSDGPCIPSPCLNGGICKISSNLSTTFCLCPPGSDGHFCQNKYANKADIVFAVDASRFNSLNDFRKVKRFLRHVVKELTLGTDNFRIAIVSFTSSATIRLDFQHGNEKHFVKSAIKSLRRMQGTPNPARALNLINSRVFRTPGGDREQVPNYVVLVTRQMGSAATTGAVNKLKVQGTKIIGVGVEMSSQEKQILQASVSFPSEQNLFTVDDASHLEDLEDDLLDFFPDEYNECRSSPCRNGGICMTRDQTYDCKCPTGFAGKNCDRLCDDLVDVALVIQSGGNVGLSGFQHIKEFAHHLIDKLNFGNNNTQLGVLTMGRRSRTHLFLNSFTTKGELHSAVEGIPYRYDRSTNLTSGMRLTRRRLFSRKKGNRPAVPDLMIIITDGLSGLHEESSFIESMTVREAGIHTVAVGVGLIDQYDFDGIVTSSAENNVLLTDSWDQLWRVEDSLLDKICRSGDVCASNPCRNGGICKPGIETDSFVCSCSPGSLGNHCEIECDHRKNVAMVLDVSGNLEHTNVILSAHFMASLVESLTANDQQYHFAVMTFNSTAVNTFYKFDSNQVPERVMSMIHTIPYPSTATAPTSANSTKNNVMFQYVIDVFDSDDRNSLDVENIVVFITHSHSKMNVTDAISHSSKLKENIRSMAIEVDLEQTRDIFVGGSKSKSIWKVKSFLDLNSIGYDVIKDVCSYADIG